jgi:hypothetical protein
MFKVSETRKHCNMKMKSMNTGILQYLLCVSPSLQGRRLAGRQTKRVPQSGVNEALRF